MTHDGNVVITGSTGRGAMAVATMNIGPVAGAITATATDTPFGQLPRNLPLDFALCQTDANANCISALAPQITVANAAQGQVLTFTVIVTGKGVTVPYIPQFNRTFVSFAVSGAPVGETGAAIKMQ